VAIIGGHRRSSAIIGDHRVRRWRQSLWETQVKKKPSHTALCRNTPRRKRRRPALFAAAVAVAAAVVAAAAGRLAAAAPPTPAAAPPEASRPAPPLQVTACIPPVAYFVERIGGANVRVQSMVPAGVEEETYAPQPRQLAGLLHSRLYVAVGLPGFPLDNRYLLPLLAPHHEVRVVAMASGVPLLGMTGGAAPPPAVTPATADPHIWLAPGTAAIIARNIAAALAAVDPARRAAFSQGLADFQRDLQALDAAFRHAAAGPRPVRFLSFHPAWGYLADQYGFRQLVVEEGGREPGTASLVALIAAARRDGVHLVLVPPGLPRHTTDALATEIGGRVLEVDYLTHDWLTMMRSLAAALAAEPR
jgi:zinc transport system substrate-binding protein